MRVKRPLEDPLQSWIERDLTAAAAADELDPAFAVDDLVQQVQDLLAAAERPVLVGDGGVGKTAVVHELVRRARAGVGPLAGRRVLQLSIRSRAVALAKPEAIRPTMQELLDAVVASPERLAIFVRDAHQAWELDLEPQLLALAHRFPGPVILEAEAATFGAMVEHFPDLDRAYVPVPVEEPSPERLGRLLADWAAAQAARDGARFDPAALEAALELTHRFLARDRQPRKSLSLLRQVHALAAPEDTIPETAVIDRFCRSYRVPALLVDPREPLDLPALEAAFAAQVLGQVEAVRAVIRLVATIRAGLTDVRRPFGALLFVGPTGVGKTHLAQLLAETLFGSRDRLVRVNLADFPAERDALVLFGDPENYQLAARRGVLHRRLLGHPFAVVLLDEFEKAHPNVHDRFLQLLDEGAFINGAGELVPCRSLVFVATSNAGAELFRGHALGFAAPADRAALDRELDRRLSTLFRVEFLNRLDQIVHFHPLSRADIRTIAARELAGLQGRAGLRRRGLRLETDEAVLDWLVAHGYDPHHGARFLRRALERHVTAAIAEALVVGAPRTGSALALTVQGRGITCQVRDAEPAATRATVRLGPATAVRARSLGRRELLAERAALVARREAVARRLGELRREADDLLGRIGASGFFDDPEAGREQLERYRRLDVALQAAHRAVEAGDALAALPAPGRDAGSDLLPLARALERAAGALAAWERVQAESGPDAVWIAIRTVDPVSPAVDWLVEVVEMERAWCARCGLEARLVAVGTSGGQATRAVLEVDGPGALSQLAAEPGVHRLVRRGRPDARVAVAVAIRGPGTGLPALEVRAVRRRPGPLGLAVAVAGRLVDEARGHTLEVLGASDGTLRHVLAELPTLLTGDGGLPEVARSYGEGGTGARDSRTGVTAPRLRDVLRGRLEPFLAGVREQRP